MQQILRTKPYFKNISKKVYRMVLTVVIKQPIMRIVINDNDNHVH